MADMSRIDAEWVVVNAFRELAKIATKSDAAKSTYDNALELGGELYPELLGSETSLLRRERESDTAREYRQKAQLISIRKNQQVAPLGLLRSDIAELRDLLAIAGSRERDRTRVDQLKKKLGKLLTAEREIDPVLHSENQLIFRDAYNVERNLPSLEYGHAHRDFELPDNNVLRVRVLHPDKPEHISGADIIYERHWRDEERATIVAVQYKIWEGKSMYLSDSRMKTQLQRLKEFTCDNQLCHEDGNANTYRFPFCAAFLRPTDKLQTADQKYLSTGEHLPICKIDECKTMSKRGADLLEYRNIKSVSLGSETFEHLFNTGKIGSRRLSYRELQRLYSKYAIASANDTVIIHAQEFK